MMRINKGSQKILHKKGHRFIIFNAKSIFQSSKNHRPDFAKLTEILFKKKREKGDRFISAKTFQVFNYIIFISTLNSS